MYGYIWLCMRGREKEKERETKIERERERERESEWERAREILKTFSFFQTIKIFQTI